MSIDDSEIIGLFAARNERAIAEVKEKYGGICRSVAKSMLKSREDAEECENDVYIVLWNRIPPAPDNLKAYICKVTKNTCLKKIEYNSAEKRNVNKAVSLSEVSENISDGSPAVYEAAFDNELGGIISRFLRTQKLEARIVFLRRYWLREPVKDIAARFSYSESKVKSMLSRTRGKLEKYLKKEGIDV